ncbi:MAG: aspartyl protease family protein, partial [Bacteroidota bacterium]
MKRIFFLLLFPLFASTQEYPIFITEEGHIVVQVQVADSITGNFILDTGAGANVLSGKMFSRIKTQAQKAGYFSGFRHDGDRLDSTAFQIPYLAIGEIKQVDPIVGIYPPLDDYGIDGLLSLKFFEDKPFTIDFVNQKLKFPAPGSSVEVDSPKITLPLSIHQHTNVPLDIFIPIQLNDSLEVLAEFDTGSGYGAYIINTNYIQDLGLDTTQVVKQPYTTQFSHEERADHTYTLSSISISGEASMIRKE